jgi:cytochrome c oxidase subunit 1
MGWMVWSHHMFTVGLGPIANSVFALTTMAIAIPTGVKVFNWIGTIWKGSLSFSTPMLYAMGFVALFTIGGISGVMHAMASSDAQQQDTYFIIAHVHYVLFGGAIMALFGGIYYWFPKITGRMYDEKMGQMQFWLLFIGQNLAFFPMHFSGLWGMPRRIYTYGDDMGWASMNMLSTVGGYVVAIATLIFLYNVVKSWRSGEKAPPDPWDGRTLEWSIPSPPPEHNFDEIPIVRDRDDWWARKRSGGQEAASAPVGGGSGNGQGIHLPQPSFLPAVVSLGLFIGGMGIIYNIAVAAIGGAIAMVSIYAWSFEPVNEPDEESESEH